MRRPGTRDGLTRTQAEKQLRELTQTVQVTSDPERTMTIAGQALLARLEAKGSSKSHIETTESHLRVHLVPFFKDKPLDRISDSDVTRLIVRLNRTSSMSRFAGCSDVGRRRAIRSPLDRLTYRCGSVVATAIALPQSADRAGACRLRGGCAMSRGLGTRWVRRLFHKEVGSMGRARRARSAAVVLAAVAATVLGGAPAGATVIDRQTFVDEPYSFSYDDCGFQVDVQGAFSSKQHLRVGKGKTDSAFFGFDNYSFVERQSNPGTGAFVTIKGNASFHEVKATRVEGSIFQFDQVEAGQFRMYDSDGRLVGFARGNIHIHILFDTEGDDVPGGIFIEELGVDVHGPHDDFCGLLTEQIGS